MADAIHGVTQFCEQMKVGDVFWHITSRYGEPYAVEGPCEIRDIFRERTRGRTVVMVQYVRPWVEIGECIVEDAVSDLVNERHGVFLNKADAAAEFDRRRVTYANNMELISELEKDMRRRLTGDVFLQPRLPWKTETSKERKR